MKEFEETGKGNLTSDEKKRLQEWIKPVVVSDDEIRRTIINYFASDKYIMDPHTAVSVHVATKTKEVARKCICLATGNF